MGSKVEGRKILEKEYSFTEGEEGRIWNFLILLRIFLSKNIICTLPELL